MRFLLTLLLAATLVGVCSAQSWSTVNERTIATKGKKDIVPTTYLLLKVDDIEMHEVLWTAPSESKVAPSESGTIINVPNRAGDIEQYRIVEYSMMESKLAETFSHMKTFIGVKVGDPHQSIRIDYTVRGFRAVIKKGGEFTYIDHYQRGDNEHRVIYKKSEYKAKHKWTCSVGHDNELKLSDIEQQRSRTGDCLFRTYRMAQTAVGEYSNYFGAFDASQVDLVHSAVVTTYNRVNQVYEAEVAARFILIDNTEDIYYYDPATDPFVSLSLNENQTNTDAVIGNANYDIGHIFIISNGGVAQLRSLCNTGSKARGLTGRPNPVGDPFDIDYVAHEIGHQFGGNHTQNNSCQRNTNTAMEPGSASTIMGYAGICSPNVQNNSDAYFHSISLAEMKTEMDNETCDAQLTWNNTAPSLLSTISNKTLPVSTPFVLEGDAAANDAGDLLTYNWEQIDNEPATMPPASTNTGGPAFRSLFATEDPKRYFPSIDNIINGTTDTWEVLPTVDRDMDFRLTVRDFHDGMGGCTIEQDVRLTFDSNSGPLVVNTANTSNTDIELQTVTVQWDVAGTDQSPVSCSEVDILMSYDGGLTYTATLLAATANDGTADITIPTGTTSTGRFMVKCSDNYFFDINNSDFTVDPGAPNFFMTTTPSTVTICQADDATTFLLETTSFMGFSEPINLVVTNAPPAATVTIANNPIIPGQSTNITLSNMAGIVGTYNVLVRGITTSLSKNINFEVVKLDTPAEPVLLAPEDEATGVDTEMNISWSPAAGASGYEYEVGTSAGSSDIAAGATATAEASISGLAIGTDYYWRVRTNSNCGNSAWSASRKFTTKECKSFQSSDLPIAISPNGTPIITSTLSTRDRGTITDMNVLDLSGTHTYISDLRFTIEAPDNTTSRIWDRPCNSQNNFDVNLDDEAPNNDWPCPPTDGGTYIPDNPLDAFDNKGIQGTWTLTVEDVFNQDGGSLQSYQYEFCMGGYCDLTVDVADYAGVGSIQNAINCAIDGDTIWLETTIPSQTISILSNTVIIDKNITIAADGPTTVTAANGNAAFEITAGSEVSFVGFDISNSGGLGLLISGDLTVENVDVTTTATNEEVLVGPLGSLTVKGECNIQQQ